MPATYNWKQRIALAVLPPVCAGLIRLLNLTLSFHDIGDPAAHVTVNRETRVYCMWHRCLLGIADHFHKLNIAILISRSFDGELIARTTRRMGYHVVHGSSSRGGAAGLLGMQRALEGTDKDRCDYAAFTADGPRGPVYRAKPGAVKLAQQIGGGVGIYYAVPDRAWELRSWDRFLIPKPFSTVIVSWQPPVPVPRDAEDSALESARQAVEDSLERARLAAEEYIRNRGKEG